MRRAARFRFLVPCILFLPAIAARGQLPATCLEDWRKVVDDCSSELLLHWEGPIENVPTRNGSGR
jgi:hypothetical protein